MKRLLCLLFTSALILTSCGAEDGPVFLSMTQGGEWFVQNQDSEFLHYQYDPLSDTYIEEGGELREMASWWVITELASYTDDTSLWMLADKGHDYFGQYFEEGDEGLIVNFDDKKDKLAYNAFAILAMLNMDEDIETIHELAEAILNQQEEGGRFNTLFNKTSHSNTDYYPGESMLALMRLYLETGTTAYKAAVSQGFEYYALEYWPENQNTAFVPWQTQAYYYYYLETGDPRVLDFIYDMNDYMVDKYVEDEACTIFDFPGNVTAVYIEGMNKAYELAEYHEDEERMQCYGQFIVQGIDHVKALQYPLTGVDPSTLPAASIGGFIVSESNHQMRVDQNQHAIMAMLGALKLGLVK